MHTYTSDTHVTPLLKILATGLIVVSHFSVSHKYAISVDNYVLISSANIPAELHEVCPFTRPSFLFSLSNYPTGRGAEGLGTRLGSGRFCAPIFHLGHPCGVILDPLGILACPLLTPLSLVFIQFGFLP